MTQHLEGYGGPHNRKPGAAKRAKQVAHRRIRRTVNAIFRGLMRAQPNQRLHWRW